VQVRKVFQTYYYSGETSVAHEEIAPPAEEEDRKFGLFGKFHPQKHFVIIFGGKPYPGLSPYPKRSIRGKPHSFLYGKPMLPKEAGRVLH
jgi:hypothetical protein